MSILHVCPQNDSAQHTIATDGKCVCKPNIQDEGKDGNGYDCRTVIHQFIQPQKGEGNRQIKKFWLDCKAGGMLKSEVVNTTPNKYGSRPRMRGAPGPML